MDVFDWAMVTIQSLSLILSFWMIVDICKQPKISNVKVLLLCLAIGNLVAGIFTLVGVSLSDGVISCTISSWMEDAGEQMSITSSAAVAMFLYRSISCLEVSKRSQYLRKCLFFIAFHTIILTLPPLFPFYFYTFGYDDGCIYIPNENYEPETFFKAVILTEAFQYLPFLLISIYYYIRLMLFLTANFSGVLKTNQLNVKNLFL